MILHIDQLQELTEFSIDIDSQQCHFPADIGRIKNPLHLDAHVRKVEDEISIEGRISAHIEMTCARCLKRHNECIGGTFEIICRPQPEEQQDRDEIELDETDLSVSYYEGGTLDLSEVLREQLLLLLPVKPLCKPDCAGLCPSCGKDINEGPCDCPKDTIDPRLAVLGKLLHPDS